MSFSETTHRGGSRFGQLSGNMFFIRNTAKPKRVRHIEGLNGALICNVNDDPSLIRSNASSSLSFTHSSLSPYGSPRRVERLVPPMGFWNTHGIIHDTERWKQELASLANASGLGIEKSDYKRTNQTGATAEQQMETRSGAHYSTRTGRFNESNGKSRGRTTTKHSTAYGNMIYQVPENEREMWMLQVLCQLLGTSSLEDVQSWLVSASPAEKEQARSMIHAALRGLKESERGPVQAQGQSQDSIDLNNLSGFVERQKYEEKYATKRFVNDSLSKPGAGLTSINEDSQSDMFDSTTHENSPENTSVSNISLQSITTYKHAYPNYYEGPFRSIGRSSSEKRDEHKQEHRETIDEVNDQIDTIQLDDDRQRSKPSSDSKLKRISHKIESTNADRMSSHHDQNTDVDTIQFNDNGVTRHPENVNDQSSSVKNLSSNQTTEETTKSRRIRELQQKLSRQEEQSKRLFNELQSKQSRLENAIKLLMKNTGVNTKQNNTTMDEQKEHGKDDSNAPVINLIIKSPRDSRPSPKSNKTNGTHQTEQTSFRTMKGPNNQQSNQQEVQVQISLSRLDDRSPKVFTGVWKPDASTIQRLQGS